MPRGRTTAVRAKLRRRTPLLCRTNLGEDTGIDAHRTMDTKMRPTARSTSFFRILSKHVQGGVRASAGPDGHSKVARALTVAPPRQQREDLDAKQRRATRFACCEISREGQSRSRSDCRRSAERDLHQGKRVGSSCASTGSASTHSSHKTWICTKGPPLHPSHADRNFEQLVLALDRANRGVVLPTGENGDGLMMLTVCARRSRRVVSSSRSGDLRFS
jgi:hypothetical protein